MKYSDPLLSTWLYHLWQHWKTQVFVEILLQAWHSFPLGFFPFFLAKSARLLAGMGSVDVQTFQGVY